MMQIYRQLLISLLLCTLAVALPAKLQSAPNSPGPEPVVSPATGYDIESPRVIYVHDPGCTVTGASTDPESSSATITQYIARTAVHGATPRRYYEFTYDEFCSATLPDIYSNVDEDGSHLYWVSRSLGGLVRLSVDSVLGDEPTLVSAFDFDTDLSDIVVSDTYVYVLEGLSGDGLFRIEKATGTASRLLGTASLGSGPFDLQSDGIYLYWRSRTGSDINLRRYRLSDGNLRTIATAVTSYRPDPVIPGIGVYVGKHNELRVYTNLIESLSPPLYSSGVEADITGVTADSLNVYFLEQPTGTGSFTVYRRANATDISTPIYTSSPTPVWQPLHQLHVDGEYLLFLQNDELLRLRTDEESVTLTNLRATGLEVTQAIQADDASVPLIQGKRTVVRLFAQSDGASVPGVTAHLYRLDGAGAVIDGPLAPRNRILDGGAWRESLYLAVPAAPDADNIAESYTFVLPPGWIDDATLRVRAELNPFHFPHEPTYGDNTATSAMFDMQPSPRLETEVVLFEYEDCSPGVCTRYVPRYLEDFLQAVSWIRRAYPLSSEPGWGDDPSPGFRPNWRIVFDDGLDERVTQSHPSCSSNSCASGYTNGILSTLRTAEGLPDSVFMYGMISDGAAFPRGQASGRVSSGPAGSDTWGWDTDGSYADWYMAHEVGHSLGRRHPSPGSAICDHSADDASYPYTDGQIGDGSLRGFDLGNPNINPALVPRIYPDDAWYDIMTYCNNLWISDYTFEAILDYLTPADASAATSAVAGGPHLQLYGLILPPNDAVLMSQVRIWPAPTSAPQPPNQGTHRLRMLDAGGGELAHFDFVPTIVEDGEGALAVDLLLPLAAGTVRVELVRLSPSENLWQFGISAHAPTVSDVKVTVNSKAETATIQWKAADADGDRLSYDLLYSANGGKQWQMVKIGIEETNTVVSTALLAGSPDGRFKVLAHDGANQGEAISPKVVIADKRPTVTVISPADGTRTGYGQLVEFVAEVYDVQDGTIPDKRILWRDQPGTLLGTGAAISTDQLRIGENRITVTATNSRGLSASDSVTVIVDDDLTLPGPSLTVSPIQVGWHVADGATANQSALLSIGNAGSGDLVVGLAEDAAWLSVNPSSGQTPFVVTLTASPTGMAPGDSWNAMLEVLGTAGALEQRIDVPVSIAMGSPFQSEPEEQLSIYLPQISQ